MRCPKCGYFSFEYLSECSKCGVGLAEVKDKLGLLAIRPNVPFFLGGLLADYTPPPGAAATSTATSAAAAGAILSEIEFGDDFDLDLSLPGGDAAPGAQPETRRGTEMSPLDLDLEDLAIDLSDEPTQAQTGPKDVEKLPELDLDMFLEPDEGKGATPGPSHGTGDSAPEGADRLDDGLTLELSEEDFEESASIEAKKGGPAFAKPGEPLASPEAELKSAKEMPTELALELDSEDLSDLILEEEPRHGSEPAASAAALATQAGIPSAGGAGLEPGPQGFGGMTLDLGDDDLIQEPKPALESPKAPFEPMAAGTGAGVEPIPLDQPDLPAYKVEDEGPEELMLELEETPKESVQPLAAKEQTLAGPAADLGDLPVSGKGVEGSEEVTIDLSAEDLDLLVDHALVDKAEEEKTTAALKPSAGERIASRAEDEMVIEISEDDLESLLHQLEEVRLEDDPAKPGKGQAKEPQKTK